MVRRSCLRIHPKPPARCKLKIPLGFVTPPNRASLVCATSKETGAIVSLTSYRPPNESDHSFDTTKVWQACRATSAATTFFDPIAIGRFGEQFVDGAFGANNPIYELWKQARDVWGSKRLQTSLRCLVSVGTGVPLLNPVRDHVRGIGKTLAKIATDTESTAEQFHHDKADLADEGRYYRFNVTRGLEYVGLEESKKRREIMEATDGYLTLFEVSKQMKACAYRLARKQCQSSPEARISSSR